MWIARDKNNYLNAFEFEPIKGSDGWKTVKGSYYPVPSKMYKEVKWTDIKAKQLIIK